MRRLGQNHLEWVRGILKPIDNRPSSQKRANPITPQEREAAERPGEESSSPDPQPGHPPVKWGPTLAFLLALVVGSVIIADAIPRASATYDEVAYLQVASHWWRTGDQESISRMGSPLTFWKLQQAPTLWLLDRMGHGDWIDDPITHQAQLLTWVRFGALWIWAAALLLTATWARWLHGSWAMAFAAWLFALSPNLIGHGMLVTMELPLVATSAMLLLAFQVFLETGRRKAFWLSAAAGGLAFSCKFTAILFPPILALIWWERACRDSGRWGLAPLRQIVPAMAGYLVILAAANLFVTGFATIPLSESRGSHPFLESRLPESWQGPASQLIEAQWPQDWVAFAIQTHHQASGGPSYLLGERRMYGWWYYYLVALAVKVPLSVGCLGMLRWFARRRLDSGGRDGFSVRVVLIFLILTCLASSRNYGVRYLLPLAPLVIVVISALAEGPRWCRRLAILGLLTQAIALATVHPYELSYFNRLAGGTDGGRRVLADSNLDWGQGARLLAQLQANRPEFRDLTLYYFGDTDPAHYGVVGVRHIINAGTEHPGLPERLRAETTYLGVSASLQWGPWGPPGYFDPLAGLQPILLTRDGTIAIYRFDELENLGGEKTPLNKNDIGRSGPRRTEGQRESAKGP